MQLRSFAFALVLLGLLTACDSTRSLVELRQASLPENAYDATLASGYRNFSAEKEAAYDWWDSKYFADKGLLAVSGHTMLPEYPAQWDIAETQMPEFEDARQQLMNLFDNARQEQGEALATAVIAYDRWVTLADAGWNSAAIEEARDCFFAALGTLQKLMEPKPVVADTTVATPVAAVGIAEPEKEPVKQPVAATSTVVYFPFNSAEVDAAAQKSIAHVVEYIQSAGKVEVVIHGHTDRTGSDEYNMALSKKRAEAVAQRLRAAGVPEGTIRHFAFGESDLKVPTDEGIREQMNRRVEIFVE